MRHAAPSILCLDLGTTTGWALYAKGITHSGSFNTKLHDGEDIGLRFLRFRRELLPTFTGVREVWFEKVRRHEGTHAAHIYGAFWGLLVAWCNEHTVPCHEVEVAAIKKAVTGRGNAKKEQIYAAIVKLGYAPADHNEADALAMLHFVRKQRLKQ